MAVANTKIIQAYIQGLVSVVEKVQSADVLGQALKAKFLTKNPSLIGTNITQAQINSVNTFLASLNTLANNGVAAAILNKNQPSHGTNALDL